MDYRYPYPAGNIEEKLLVVLNKVHLPTRPIIVIPVKTNKTEKKYVSGCNPKKILYYILKGVDFFTSNTVIPITATDAIPEDTFNKKMAAKEIVPMTPLQRDTIEKLMGCVEKLKDYIDEDYHIDIF